MESLALVATGIGIGRLLPHIKNIHDSQNVEAYSIPYTCLGILASILWIIYDIKKDHKIGLITVIIGLLAECYILCILLKKEHKSN